MDLEDIIDNLNDISEWVRKQTEPDPTRQFSRCPVCHTVWWREGQFSIEKHEQNCWVPGLKNIIEEAKHV